MRPSLALAALARLAVAGPIWSSLTGNESPEDIDPRGSLCTTQWYFKPMAVGLVRNYHTRLDGSIVESRLREDGSWTSAAILLDDAEDASETRAAPGSSLACAGESVGYEPDDVQIRLFYQRAGDPVRLHSIVYAKGKGWRPDDGFNDLFGMPASAGAAVKWVNPRTNEVDWRLYYAVYDRMQRASNRVSARVYEAALRTHGTDKITEAWRGSTRLAMELLVDKGGRAELGAAVFGEGRQISLVGWTLRADKSLGVGQKPAALREARRADEARGWTSREQTLNGMGFASTGTVAVAPYVDPESGHDVLLTVAKYHEAAREGRRPRARVEQLMSVGEDVWQHLMAEPPAWVGQGSAAAAGMAAAAWLGGPAADELQVSVQYIVCGAAAGAGGCGASIKEARRNTANWLGAWTNGTAVARPQGRNSTAV